MGEITFRLTLFSTSQSKKFQRNCGALECMLPLTQSPLTHDQSAGQVGRWCRHGGSQGSLAGDHREDGLHAWPSTGAPHQGTPHRPLLLSLASRYHLQCSPPFFHYNQPRSHRGQLQGNQEKAPFKAHSNFDSFSRLLITYYLLPTASQSTVQV